MVVMFTKVGIFSWFVVSDSYAAMMMKRRSSLDVYKERRVLMKPTIFAYNSLNSCGTGHAAGH